jgi:hypothetical protein
MPLVVALTLGVLLAAGRPLEFTPRFPTAPNPGSWANPYEATDPVTGERYELKPRLPDLGPASSAAGEPFAPGSVENPWEVAPHGRR